MAGHWSEPLLWTPYKRYENVAPADIPPGFTSNSVTGLIGIHTHVTPDGKVLSWEGHNDNANGGHLAHAYTWNPNPNARNGTQAYPNVYSHYDNLSSNLFCSGHSFLADGRLLVAGGHYSLGEVYNPQIAAATFPQDVLSTRNYGYGYVGLRDLNTFNYLRNTTINAPDYVWQTSVDNSNSSTLPRPTLLPMSARRWYPTSTTLGDGRAVVVSGLAYVNATGVPVQGPPEVYNPTTNTWQVLGNAARQLPLYPWLFLAPDGRVFNAGPNPDAKSLDVSAGTWDPATYPTRLGQYREYGSAVMYAPGKVLILGGATGAGVTKTAERIDLTAGSTPQFQPAAPMLFPRTHVNATILADGSVLATGGTRAKTASDTDAVLHAELWGPDNANSLGGTWALMSEMSTPRLYHATAVLLPDATVLTTSGGQGGGQGGGYADHPDYEIFTPPYLCKGLNRSVISSAPQTAAYGERIIVRTPQANSIVANGRATLVRLSSVTHAFNMNQRFLELPRSGGSVVGELYLRMPTNPNDCPPGHHMLFLIDGNGTPSLASMVAITTNSCPHYLSITQTLVSQTPCDRITRFKANGGVANASYIWTVDGVVNGQSTGEFIELPTCTDVPSVQVQVTQNADCGASSSLTSYFPRCNAPPCRNCLPQRTK